MEAGKQNGPQGEALLTPLLTPFVGKLDALVLGCTHYPFAETVIRKILGPDTALLDGGEGTAAQTMQLLKSRDLLYDGPGTIEFENSAEDPAMLELSRKLAQT